jgi:hypothetical protein
MPTVSDSSDERMTRKTLWPFALLIVFVCYSCASTENWTETDWKLAQLGISPEEHASQVKQGQLRQRYLYDVLYVGMPEEQFLKLFTKTSAWTDPDRPYIAQRQDHTYILLATPRYDNDRARVTFKDGDLVKCEEYGQGDNPWGYSDSTFLLRGP